MAAVNQNGRALKYVKDQAEGICIAAVNQNGRALEYVKDQTPAICMAAINQNNGAEEYVIKTNMYSSGKPEWSGTKACEG
jgi:hypothetical protein